MRKSYVDGQIERIVVAMENQEVTSKEYSDSLNQLEKLQRIRKEETPGKVSFDTMFSTAGNLLGILLIIRHEHVNVIASRAMNMVQRLR